MQRRRFSREFKLEAVKLVRERGYRQHRLRVIWTCTRTCCASGSRSSAPTRHRRFPAMAR